MSQHRFVITYLALLQLAKTLEVDEESLSENFIASDCLSLHIEPPPRPDICDCKITNEQSWHSINKGKLSKKQRRS